jgi:hypothetical protein
MTRERNKTYKVVKLEKRVLVLKRKLCYISLFLVRKRSVYHNTGKKVIVAKISAVACHYFTLALWKCKFKICVLLIIFLTADIRGTNIIWNSYKVSLKRTYIKCRVELEYN